MTMGSDLAPRGPARGRFLGIYRLLGDVGTIGGPLVVRALRAHVRMCA